MQEQEFFSNENVYVSNARFVVSGQTFAMSGVTSVKASTVAANRLVPTLMLIVSFLCFLAGGAGIVFGLALLVLTGLLWISQKQEHVVLLSTASGEVKALRSQNPDLIAAVVQALNDCIVARG